ncbi:FabD/lysophospholipase-like protein [Cristinia sonorae]|uniref:Lysophospholipase n=1 Tax=Cristinia sonorae TaxID=1940300 RepID=A0A8K0XPC8_9AGAR|nr:FabD/lysophospholipase-like protein [Cristinia sonorae]
MSAWSWPTTLDFSTIQSRVSALFLELGLGPGSLYSEIVHEPADPTIHPEIEWDAEVRLGNDLCISERAFLHERRRAMREPFAKLIGVSVEEVDERDLPVVAIAGSGGGYRAMLNTVGSLIGAQATGVLPCTSYVAGVSGHCWALAVMYPGVAGYSPRDVGQHLKERIDTSYLDMVTLEALTTPPTNKFLLAGLLRKAAGPTGMASLVDVYGTLLASRLFVPTDIGKMDSQHLSLHLIRRKIDNGQLPLPIFTAVQNVTSSDNIVAIQLAEKEKALSVDAARTTLLDKAEATLAKEIRCLWYEFTPFEIGCDEVGAWIPSWAFGRRFEAGRNSERRPELGLTILSGIFGSAFCASLKHYFQEIQPTLKLLPIQLYGWLENIVTENDRDLGLIHPVLPDQLPNFLKGLDGQLREGAPPDISAPDYMGFMLTLSRSTAELNLPYYPLLRRDVDCVIALDASADSQDLWFTRAEELAAKRGLKTWPKGAGWPSAVQSEVVEDIGAGKADRGSSPSVPPASADATDFDANAANLKLAHSQESALAAQTDKQESTEGRDMPRAASGTSTRDAPLSACEVWIGSSRSTETESSRLDELDEAALLRRDGIGVVYIPLAPNEQKVPGFDPFSISTWRREVTQDESQSILDVAEANFSESREKIVKLLRVIWMRKRRAREEAEWRDSLAKFQRHMRDNLR